jgi:peptidoglycan-N-acetylglucosamine deacetylase
MGSVVIAGGLVLGSAAVAAWGAVYPGAQVFGRTLRITGDSSTLALTFDDGPNPAVTPALLDLLDQHGARATFFLMGQHARAFPELTREIAARGHVIGNHTETHPNLIFVSAARLQDELSRCHKAIETIAAYRPRWVRPPFGFRGPGLSGAVRRLGYSGVAMWSRLVRDWRAQAAEPVIRRLRRTGGGDIVLLHDGDHRSAEGDRHHTVAALAYWLPRWKNAGLRCVTVDDIDPLLAGFRDAAGQKASG